MSLEAAEAAIAEVRQREQADLKARERQRLTEANLAAARRAWEEDQEPQPDTKDLLTALSGPPEVGDVVFYPIRGRRARMSGATVGLVRGVVFSAAHDKRNGDMAARGFIACVRFFQTGARRDSLAKGGKWIQTATIRRTNMRRNPEGRIEMKDEEVSA